MTKQEFWRGVGAVVALILFTCCVIFASREVDREPAGVVHYKTLVRCYNCSSHDNRRGIMDVQFPIGQSIMDPKSKCPKCQVSFAVGR